MAWKEGLADSCWASCFTDPKAACTCPIALEIMDWPRPAAELFNDRNTPLYLATAARILLRITKAQKKRKQTKQHQNTRADWIFMYNSNIIDVLKGGWPADRRPQRLKGGIPHLLPRQALAPWEERPSTCWGIHSLSRDKVCLVGSFCKPCHVNFAQGTR